MKPMTFFLDLDGTVFEHKGKGLAGQHETREVLPGVHDFFIWCQRNGHRIVIATGRKRCMEEITHVQLRDAGLAFDDIVFDCTPGKRVIINDGKPDSDVPTCDALQVARNDGLATMVDRLSEA